MSHHRTEALLRLSTMDGSPQVHPLDIEMADAYLEAARAIWSNPDGDVPEEMGRDRLRMLLIAVFHAGKED